MLLEIGCLVLERLLDLLVVLDVELAAIDDADDAQLDGYDTSAEHVVGVRAVVHEVELGDDGERASTVGIGVARQLERLGRGEVGVGRRDGEYDRVGVVQVGEQHLAYLLLDVSRLVADRHLGHARQVDQSERDHSRREYLEYDRVVRDALVLASHALRLRFDFLPNLVEVREHFVLHVQENAPLVGIFGH